MRTETAMSFWKRYINLVRSGGRHVLVNAPTNEFAVGSRAGEYDGVSDSEYAALMDDCEQLRAIWGGEQRLTAGEVLLRALSLTDFTDSQRDALAAVLAEISAGTDYAAKAPKGRSPGPEEAEAPAPGGPGECLPLSPAGDITPRAIYDYLGGQVLGQDPARRAAAMILYNHLHGRRSNCVFCGPSGCGKSEIWRQLSRAFPGLVRIVDASRLSADGWKGSLHLRDIFEDADLSDGCGLIVVLDEADKICCESAVGSSGTDYNVLIQNNLLKVLDGDTVDFGAEDSRRGAFSVDCSNVSVVLLGAFEGLLRGKSRSAGSIGFGGTPRRELDYNTTEITYGDLIAAGMRREIAGRINRIVTLAPLTASDYRSILQGPVLAALQRDGRRVLIDDASARLLSEQAVASGLGVRWMRSRLINALDDMVFTNPTAPAYTLILISNQNKTFATVFFAPCCVSRLGNTQSIPCGAFLAWHEKSSPLGVFF